MKSKFSKFINDPVIGSAAIPVFMIFVMLMLIYQEANCRLFGKPATANVEKVILTNNAYSNNVRDPEHDKGTDNFGRNLEYSLLYNFTAENGTKYEGNDYIRTSYKDHFKAGDNVRINYIESDPNKTCLIEISYSHRLYQAGIIFIVAPILLFGYLRIIRRRSSFTGD